MTTHQSSPGIVNTSHEFSIQLCAWYDDDLVPSIDVNQDFMNRLKEQLQQHHSAVWSGIQQTVVDEASNKWRRYLWACVRAKRCHFEHLL